jgi:hypothetical protein
VDNGSHVVLRHRAGEAVAVAYVSRYEGPPFDKIDMASREIVVAYGRKPASDNALQQ